MFVGSGPTGKDTVVEVWLQPLRNASRKPSKNGYRVKGYAVLEEGEANEYLAPTGPRFYAARYCFVDKATGQRTAFREIPVTGAVR